METQNVLKVQLSFRIFQELWHLMRRYEIYGSCTNTLENMETKKNVDSSFIWQ